jgi:hypothetical protein
MSLYIFLGNPPRSPKTPAGFNENNVENIQLVGTSTVVASPASLNGILAIDNILTNSVASQIANQNDINIGNTNEVRQVANAIMAEDILTKGGALQKINEDSLVLGNANTISHDGALTITANTVTDGSILQQTDIFSSS